MPCGFMKAKKKIQQFLKAKVAPIAPKTMTQPEISAWTKEIEHAMDEALSDPVERSKVTEKMKKIIRLQPKMPGVGYNPNVIRIEKLEEEGEQRERKR